MDRAMDDTILKPVEEISYIRAKPWHKAVFIGILSLLSLTILLPLMYVVSISLSSDMAIAKHGYRLIPTEFSLQAYRYLLSAPGQILRAYWVSFAATASGTALGLFLTTTLAYVMTRRDYALSRFTSFFVFFTMLFTGGVVPTYMVMKSVLNLGNSFFALFIPYSLSAWFTLLMKGFMQSVPFDIIESGKIDGAGELRIFVQLVLPLVKPAIATIGLFYVFLYWNDWWLAMLYMNTEAYVPIQYLLYRMLNNLDFILRNLSSSLSVDLSSLPGEAVRMAVALLAAGPMLLVFPFFQRYFVKGITVGSIKG